MHSLLRAGNWPFLVVAFGVTCAAAVTALLLRRSEGGRRLLARVNSADRLCYRAMVALAVAYFLIYSYLSVQRYYKLLCGNWDLGIFESLFTNALHGKFFVDYRGPFDHFQPGAIVFLPFYALWPDGRMILILQTAVLTLAVWPLYLFAKEVSGRVLVGALVGILYLLYPFLTAGNLYDFHALSLSPLFFFSMLLFLVRRREGLYWLFMLFLLSAKESEAIIVFGVGLYLLSQRKLRLGALTVAAALAWGYLSTFVLMPAITGQTFRHLGRYEGLGDWVTSTFETYGVGLPVAAYVARVIAVLLFILVPIGFLPLRRFWPFVLIFGPTFAVNMASKVGFQNLFWGHYGITAVSAIFAASVFATRDIKGLEDKAKPSALPLFLIVIAGLSNLFLSFPANHRVAFPSARLEMSKSFNVMSIPLPVTAARRSFFSVAKDERFIMDAAGLLPAGSTVAVQNDIGYLLVNRCRTVDLSETVTADYYLLYELREDGFTAHQTFQKLYERLGADPDTVCFLVTNPSGHKWGTIFIYAKRDKWFEFYTNALQAAAREPDNPSYRMAVTGIQKMMGIRGPDAAGAGAPETRGAATAE